MAMGVVQYYAFFSIQGDNTVEITILRKIHLLGLNRHLDETNDALHTVFRYFIYLP